MSNYSDIAAGLVTILQNGVTGLHAYNHPVDSVHEFPAAVLLPEAFDPEIAFGGNTFEAAIRVVVLVASGDTAEGFAALYDHMDPTEANKSFIKAVRDAPTLDGKVDSSRVGPLENVGRRELWGGFYFGFDMLVHFVKTVA